MNLVATGQQKNWNGYASIWQPIIFTRNPKAQKHLNLCGRVRGNWLSNKAASAGSPNGIVRRIGRARIALDVEPPFKQYVFIEREAARAQELEKLKLQFPDKATCVTIVREDANTYLKEWCKRTEWRACRAVMFLDPYGMQVDWSLIEAIAKTRAVDLWILFPLGVAVNRLLKRAELPPKKWAEALTRILGTEEWRDSFYSRQVERTLFADQEVRTKEADFSKISRYFVERLKRIFTAWQTTRCRYETLEMYRCICCALLPAIRGRDRQH